jgi:hypothetical protein
MALQGCNERCACGDGKKFKRCCGRFTLERPACGALKWEQMQEELAMDVVEILDRQPATDYIVGVIQWRANSLAAVMYEACSVRLVPECAANLANVIPDPDKNQDRWQAVNRRLVDINGVPIPGNFPAFYFVKTRAGGEGVAFPRRASKDQRVRWSTQDDLIDHVAHCLVGAGLLRCVSLKSDTWTVEKKQHGRS